MGDETVMSDRGNGPSIETAAPASRPSSPAAQLTFLVFLRRKSIRMNWPSVIVFVK